MDPAVSCNRRREKRRPTADESAAKNAEDHPAAQSADQAAWSHRVAENVEGGPKKKKYPLLGLD